MKNDEPASADGGRIGDEPQSALQNVAVVQCEGFRCLAFRDSANRWWDLHTGKELPEVKEIVQTFSA